MKGVSQQLARLLALWHATPDTLTHVREGANSVYEFQALGSRHFLRVTEESHRSRDQLEAELDFVRFVASRDVAVALPQASVRGEWVETLHRNGAPIRHAVVFSAAPGRHFQFFSSDIARPLFHAWGLAMGTLHLASKDFVPPTSRRRPSWSEQDTTACRLEIIPETEKEARCEYHRITEWLESVPTNTSWGLIHGDFERTNFVLDDGTLWLYDFDDACYHWYIADIAHAVWAFRNAPRSDRTMFLVWFLEGYQERCPLDVDVREHVSWFVRLRTLALFINRLHSGSSDAEWVRRTRAALEAPISW